MDIIIITDYDDVFDDDNNMCNECHRTFSYLIDYFLLFRFSSFIFNLFPFSVFFCLYYFKKTFVFKYFNLE